MSRPKRRLLKEFVRLSRVSHFFKVSECVMSMNTDSTFPLFVYNRLCIYSFSGSPFFRFVTLGWLVGVGVGVGWLVGWV